MVTIHYHRYDADYDGVAIWTWDGHAPGTKWDRDLEPVGEDEFGSIFKLDPADYLENSATPRVGFIPRIHHDWNWKDGGDRFWTPELGDQLWLIAGDPIAYTHRPDVTPRVEWAYLDGERIITLRLTHPATLGSLVPSHFHILDAQGTKCCDVVSVRALDPNEGRAHTLELTTFEAPEFRKDLFVSTDEHRAAELTPRRVLHDGAKLFRDVELGAICEDHQTTFRVFCPSARAVDVVLYNNAQTKKGRTLHPMTDRGLGIWEAVIAGDLDGKYYMIRADNVGSHVCREAVDPHSRCNGNLRGHGRVTNLRRTDPPDFRPVTRPATMEKPTDAVIYEVSVRDFTADAHSGVPEELRGKFLGASLRGTQMPGTLLSTGIDHLVELGVTHVQFLPIQDFDLDEESDEYNWGYMTACFNSPEGSYATNIYNDSRMMELKQMIAAFHKAGIRVIMDVVYNHTSPFATFEALAPGYFFRQRWDGSFWNGSGCGNEFRTEAPMARKFIVDSCLYWIKEFGVDGFRFDLMALVDLDTMIYLRDALRKIDPTLLVYGEPWAAQGPEGCGIPTLTTKHVLRGTGIGSFNDHFRNALKGSPDGGERGYVQSGEGRDRVKQGIEGAIHDWAQDPTEVIQYATCHDNLTLWDKLAISTDRAPEEARLKMQALTAGILAVSQGVMFLHGGHELARTKQGHHNSYNLPDEINRIEWERKDRFEALFLYMQGMIALRRAHPLFRLATRGEVEARLAWRDDLCMSPHSLVFEINGEGVAGESWKHALVVINPDGRDYQFNLPPGDWQVHVQGQLVTGRMLFKASGTIYVPERSLVVLAH
ncbi:type I pullulanase [Candidatus Sumerlaeota bacterium]|nr:type I pullulanase [Candidatus Sumerlaeota bacterium]